MPSLPSLRDPQLLLFPSLYCLLPPAAILAALRDTGTASQRQRRLPAQDAVWLVIAPSLFRDRRLPKVWRPLHPSRDEPEPSCLRCRRGWLNPGALPPAH